MSSRFPGIVLVVYLNFFVVQYYPLNDKYIYFLVVLKMFANRSITFYIFTILHIFVRSILKEFLFIFSLLYSKHLTLFISH